MFRFYPYSFAPKKKKEDKEAERLWRNKSENHKGEKNGKMEFCNLIVRKTLSW